MDLEHEILAWNFVLVISHSILLLVFTKFVLLFILAVNYIRNQFRKSAFSDLFHKMSRRPNSIDGHGELRNVFSLQIRY